MHMKSNRRNPRISENLGKDCFYFSLYILYVSFFPLSNGVFKKISWSFIVIEKSLWSSVETGCITALGEQRKTCPSTYSHLMLDRFHVRRVSFSSGRFGSSFFLYVKHLSLLFVDARELKNYIPHCVSRLALIMWRKINYAIKLNQNIFSWISHKKIFILF